MIFGNARPNLSILPRLRGWLNRVLEYIEHPVSGRLLRYLDSSQGLLTSQKDIYFCVIIGGDDLETALEGALEFFPGIKLKREQEYAAKAGLSNGKTFSEF